MPDRKLGRGLDGLLHGIDAEQPGGLVSGAAVSTVPVSELDANPYQPRQGIDAAELERLKDSIREHGVLQPILVRQHGTRYQIVAGERRVRAAEALGLAEVPAVVREVPDDRMLELALIENLQREDLDPIEKAESFRAYLANTSQTQDSAARRLGLDRSTMANMIRLLDLPLEVQALVRSGLVAMGHARAILALEDPKRQAALAERVAREGLSVRQVERIVSAGATRRQRRVPVKSPHVRDLEARLREAFGTKVSVEEGQKPGTGKITIEFFSHEDLERILALLT